jgi:Flp pilus assembly protein TadD
VTSDGRDGARQEAHRLVRRKLSNLAGVLAAQGDLDGARPLFERALAIREARLGPDHPDTVRSREKLALVVAALEKSPVAVYALRRN